MPEGRAEIVALGVDLDEIDVAIAKPLQDAVQAGGEHAPSLAAPCTSMCRMPPCALGRRRGVRGAYA